MARRDTFSDALPETKLPYKWLRKQFGVYMKYIQDVSNFSGIEQEQHVNALQKLKDRDITDRPTLCEVDRYSINDKTKIFSKLKRLQEDNLDELLDMLETDVSRDINIIYVYDEDQPFYSRQNPKIDKTTFDNNEYTQNYLPLEQENKLLSKISQKLIEKSIENLTDIHLYKLYTNYEQYPELNYQNSVNNIIKNVTRVDWCKKLFIDIFGLIITCIRNYHYGLMIKIEEVQALLQNKDILKSGNKRSLLEDSPKYFKDFAIWYLDAEQTIVRDYLKNFNDFIEKIDTKNICENDFISEFEKKQSDLDSANAQNKDDTADVESLMTQSLQEEIFKIIDQRVNDLRLSTLNFSSLKSFNDKNYVSNQTRTTIQTPSDVFLNKPMV